MKKKSECDYVLVDKNNLQLVEAYKTLRTNFEYSIINSKGKRIIVTSSVAQEGKSHVTANLGYFLAKKKYKVLLMDCDFRKPRLHHFFSLSGNTGISNVIYKKKDLTLAIKRASSNLHLLCTGPLPPNAIEILSSLKFEEVLETLSDIYDYILIDTPPSLYLSDACVLAPNVDGILFVIKYGSTPIDIIKKAMSNLQNVNANIIGTVLTQIKTGKFSRYTKYMHVNNYADCEQQQKNSV